MSTAEPTTRRARRTQAEERLPVPAPSDLLSQGETRSSSTELSLPERALAAMKLTVTVDQLTELAAKTVDIQAITNNDGRTQAHAAAMVLKEQRLVIERAGKAAREDATKFAKQVIVEADKLIALISPEEERLIKLRDEWDAAREAEKRAKLEAERQRLLAIQQRIQDIRDMVAEAAGKSAAQIGELIRTLTAIVIDDSFEASKAAAEQVHAKVLARLRSMQDQQARIEQERAEAAERDRQRKIELDAEIARQREQRELQQQRLKRIADINGLVLVATTGRSDRKSGTRECITETLAEARGLLINEAQFGDMLQSALAARDAAVQQIEHLLQRFDQRAAEMLEQQRREQEIREQRAQQQAEQQRIDAEREAAQAEQRRIAAENARQADELRRQQEALEQQRREQDLQRAELERQQQQLAASQVAQPAAATEPEAPADLSTDDEPSQEFAPTADDIIALVSSEYGVAFNKSREWCVNAFANYDTASDEPEDRDGV